MVEFGISESCKDNGNSDDLPHSRFEKWHSRINCRSCLQSCHRKHLSQSGSVNSSRACQVLPPWKHFIKPRAKAQFCRQVRVQREGGTICLQQQFLHLPGSDPKIHVKLLTSNYSGVIDNSRLYISWPACRDWCWQPASGESGGLNIALITSDQHCRHLLVPLYVLSRNHRMLRSFFWCQCLFVYISSLFVVCS